MDGPTPEAVHVHTTPESNPGTADERRRDPRYRPLAASAYVGWWEGEAFRTELGVIQNVSAGGAALSLEAPLAGVTVVWLCLVGPGRVTWVPARVVSLERHLARIQFAEPCGDHLLAPLIWGLAESQEP